MPPAMPSPPAGAAPQAPDLPRSSVGATFAIRRRPRVLAYLIEKEGEAIGRVHQLDDDVTDIGRDPRNHIVLSDVMISGFHARVERGPDGAFIVQDRQSTNGTSLNGEPLTDMRPLNENDELKLGNTALVLKVVS
jgi:pSer/pThr/pTyr-binding forkhead associated (FHA) protein